MQQPKLVSLDGLASLVIHHFMCDEMLVGSDGLGQLFEESGIRYVSGPKALFVENSNDPPVPLFHQLTDNLVVKILHWLPLVDNNNNNNIFTYIILSAFG